MSLKIIYTGLNFPTISIPSNVKLYHYPTIAIDYKIPKNNLSELLLQTPHLAFFSKNAVVALSIWSKKSKMPYNILQNCTIWSVGKATATEVKKLFNKHSLIPITSNAQGMIASFATLKPSPLILFTAKEGRKEFSQWLTKNNWQYSQIPVYETKLLQNLELNNAFTNKDEYIVFTSPSTVKGFAKSIAQKDLSQIHSKLVTIGPTTSKEVIQLGAKVFLQAKEPQAKSLLQQLISCAS